MFIGREAEIAFLQQKYKAPGGQLVVLYGRRRVGKTETLREFCKDKTHIFYACRECSDVLQLQSFSTRVLTPEMPAARYIKTFADWHQAFSAIADMPGNEKKLLVIDEFPYMAKNNKSIPSILQNLWDERLKDENIMIILCGSSMSFIENELLAEKNPLYGRATGILKMREMGFYDAIQFFPDYSNEDKIAAYSILGGIPHYLKQFDSKQPICDNIQNHILTRGSILYSEVEFLMRQELRETVLYNTIIEAVALGNTKLNDIFNKTTIEKTKLSVYIKNLISLGVMQREFSVDAGLKERANTHRGQYHLTDPFFSFWYHFVFPNLSELEAGDSGGVYRYSIKPALSKYISYQFENICRQFVRQQNIRGLLPFRYEKLGRYFDSKNEIDIMAVSKDKRQWILGECKYKNSPFGLEDLHALQAKLVPAQQTQAYYYLFSKSGFSKDVMDCMSEQVRLIGLDGLFEWQG